MRTFMLGLVISSLGSVSAWADPTGPGCCGTPGGAPLGVTTNANAGANSNAAAVNGSSMVTNNNQQDMRTSSQSGAVSSSDNANNAQQSVNFAAQARNPVNTAYAAPLIAGEDTCMGSSSIGGQGVGFGISIGTSWTDENCQRLKNSRQLASLGYQKAAVMLLCINDDVATAMEAAGTPCRVRQEEASLRDRRTTYVASLFEGGSHPQLAQSQGAVASMTEAPQTQMAESAAPVAQPQEVAVEDTHAAPYTVAMTPVQDRPSKKLRLRKRR